LVLLHDEIKKKSEDKKIEENATFLCEYIKALSFTIEDIESSKLKGLNEKINSNIILITEKCKKILQNNNANINKLSLGILLGGIAIETYLENENCEHEYVQTGMLRGGDIVYRCVRCGHLTPEA